MDSSSNPEIREIDVRKIIESGGSPLSIVMETVAVLPASASLRLIAPFEPVPLCAKLAELGFDHKIRQREDGAFEVHFTRQPPPPEPSVLDLRDTNEAAMVEHVLDAIGSLAFGQLLIVRTHQNPETLCSRLDEIGASWDAEPLSDGTWQTCVAAPLPGA